MNFTQSIRICFQKFADFKGRASRSEFWYYYLFVILVNIISVFLALQITSFFVVWFIFALISFVPALAVTARRLHDIGKSGWWQILAYIPYVGILFSINVEKIRIFLSSVLNLDIFPSDIYFLEKVPSEINFNSIVIIFVISLIISAIASYLPASRISKMSTFRALRYE